VARRSLEQQRRPTPRAFFILCSHALEHAKTKKRIPQPLWTTWFPDRGVKELLSLLKLADSSPWNDGSYRATVLGRLNGVGHYKLAINYWKKHKGEIETDVATWSETGRALASLERRKEARKVLSSWRGRRGVSMWVIANYIGCLSPLKAGDLKEIVASCGDALRDLSHDHCARFLVHAKAEACALLGDKQALRETWDHYRSYFDCKEDNSEWFEDRRRPLLTDIPMIVRFLEQNQLSQYRRAVWQIRWRHISRLLKTRIRLTGSVSIPWGTVAIIIWALIQLFRNS
jgi:hypothetical protein